MKRKLALAQRDAAVAKRIARWQRKFLSALAKTPSVKHAAQVAGIHRNTAYEWRRKDPDFSDRFQQAIDASVDDLEAKAFRFVLSGPPKDNSGVNAWVNLVQFMLRCHRGSVYRDVSRMEIDGRHVGVILLPEKELRDP